MAAPGGIPAETSPMAPGSLRLLLAMLAALLALAIVPALASATTYYVSPSGRDASSGRSPSHAWRTVFRVDKAALHPGDNVLFEGGATFSDDALQPGWGTTVSGTSAAPIVFGTYGSGRATLSDGIWLKGEHNLVYENFNLGAKQGIEGTGNYDVIQSCSFRNFLTGPQIAINVVGSHWTIRGNTIANTGDSGMLLRGDSFLVVDNTISNTGLDPEITYGSHGIYLKATNSQVIDNTITNFRDDGISVRYRNSLVEGNIISGGKFGVAWFQYDTISGVSHWIDNSISDTSIAGIYVSPSDIGGPTREKIVIEHNRIFRPAHASSADRSYPWQGISLSKDVLPYIVAGNAII